MDKHPRAQNFYSYISRRKEPYFEEFRRIYNDKCAYCGVSVEVVGITCFEVDHYICRNDIGQQSDRNRINKANNLKFACSACNGSKKDFLITRAYEELLDPDGEEVSTVFFREDDYSIIICAEYEDDPYIREYYSQLKLGYDVRRLDYLLMQMRSLLVALDSDEQALLSQAILLLQDKRNSVYWWSENG